MGRPIRRWDAVSGDPFGFLLIVHHEGKRSLAISSEGELLVSVHGHGTVGHW